MTEPERVAVYTATDEICLSYPDATGVLVLLYYSPSQYAKRQHLHGTATYPQPATLELH